MAFLHAAPDLEGRRAQRFSLLLLEHGESYFEDFGVNYYPPGTDSEAMKGMVKGRLRLCSRSVVLEPTDIGQPLLKFSFRKCTSIDRWSAPLFTPIRGEVMVLVATEYVRMRNDSMPRPYEFVKLSTPMEFRFSPTYVSLAQMLSKVRRLFEVWQLPGREISTALSVIADEYARTTSFNTAWLEELSERILLETAADMVLPLVLNQGRVVLTTKRIYFQPLNNIDSEPVRKFKIADITRIINRRYLLRDVGVELFLPGEKCLYLTFTDTAHRDEFAGTLKRHPDLKLQSDDQSNMLLSWQCGAISNYDYLMYLNIMADRSFVDLAQYPVFPWVIADYVSSTLDLSKPSTYRDLSKPIGALREDRLQGTLARYHEMPEPKFMYGSHYSTPGYVLFYTIRVAPQYSLCLQNGRYDHADRLFNNVAETWQNVLTSTADVKELIPEFYMPGGEFLSNSMGLDLGVCQDGAKVGNVVLPPWATSPVDFVQKCREALESDYVSANIHNWIDLIFGYKQRGQEAIRANNLFYHLTYEGSVDLDKITDENQRLALETQILEFGQTPRQLFTLPHPSRRAFIPQSPAFTRTSTFSNTLSPSLTVPATPMYASIGSSSLLNSNGAGAGGVGSGSGEDSANGSGSMSSGVGSGVGAVIVGESVNASDESKQQEPPKLLGWDQLARLTCHSTVKAHKSGINSMYNSASTHTLYTVSKDSTLKLHSLENDQQLQSVQLGVNALSSCVPYNDGKIVCVGSWNNSIYLYSTEYARVIDELSGHDDAITSLAIANDYLLSASWDSTIKVWKLSESSRGRNDGYWQELTEHDGEVTVLRVFESRNIFASGGKDGKVIIWDLTDFSPKHVFDAHTQGVNAISFSPDGRRLASCGEDGFVRVFDVELFQVVLSTDTIGVLSCLAYDGQYIVGGDKNGVLMVYHLLTLCCVFREQRHTGAITCLSVSPEGSLVVTAGDDRCYCVWRA